MGDAQKNKNFGHKAYMTQNNESRAMYKQGSALLKEIERKKIDIREVMAYAVKTLQIDKETARNMSLDDFRTWIRKNKLVLTDNE